MILYHLKKKPNIKFDGIFKMGIKNHFTIYKNIKRLVIGNNVSFRNYIHILVMKNAELIIKDNVFMNNNCSINCMEKIDIGRNTIFGENVKIYDHNHKIEIEKGLQFASHTEFTTAPVTIGNHCWLGSNVTILKGVTIGDNSIIGAGCVIHKSIPPNTTVINKQNLLFKTD